MGLLNTRGGNRTKRQKKHKQEQIGTVEDEQMFAKIISNNGGRHFKVLCTDNIERIGRICTSMVKGQRLTAGVFVIISLRQFESEQSTKCDIIGIGNPPYDIIKLFQQNQSTESCSSNGQHNIVFYNDNNQFSGLNTHTNAENNIEGEENNNNIEEGENKDMDDINFDDI